MMRALKYLLIAVSAILCSALVIAVAFLLVNITSSRPCKNVGEAASARQKQAKKRTLRAVNEHFEPVFNAAMATQVVFQRSASDADATYEFRGRYKPSTDGKTYLVIEHDNGGGCGSLSVDGNRWPHRLHEAGEVMPGMRTIQCGGKIDIEIRPGNIYYFNYWGP